MLLFTIILHTIKYYKLTEKITHKTLFDEYLRLNGTGTNNNLAIMMMIIKRLIISGTDGYPTQTYCLLPHFLNQPNIN